ncbi:MAG: hypothetical protein KGP28_05700, partial [Bdellovibrionales bacterium]|nr:hypothetical protein [Bdellovibrionales bacterium]
MKSSLSKLSLCIPLFVACQAKAPLSFEIPKSLVESALVSPPNVSFSETSVTVSESAGSVAIGLRLSSPSPLTVRVPVIPNGNMTGLSEAVAEFAPGSTNTILNLPIPNNSSIDQSSPRNINLVIGLPQYANQGMPGSLELRIIDDERPMIRFQVLDQNVAENSGPITITAISDRPFSGPNSVNVGVQASGSAANQTDYTL